MAASFFPGIADHEGLSVKKMKQSPKTDKLWLK